MRWLTLLASTALLIFLAIFLGFKVTENGTYYVEDYSGDTPKTLKTYHHFNLALHYFEKSDQSSLCIKNEDGKRVAIKEGIVDFNTKDVSENTTYEVDGSDLSGYTNGNYGADALYLGTNSDGTKAKFLLSGTIGWVDIRDVRLKVVTKNVHISYYQVKDKKLYHYVSTNVSKKTRLELVLDDAPSFLKTGKKYYSYDGHWFYTNLTDMTKDYESGTHENAVNSEAYYNFYQFVPHRSLTTLKKADYNKYLKESRGITETAYSYPCADTQSVLYDMGADFLKAQKNYHINATMMFCVAMNESGYGQSSFAILNNNLFGHSVYDSSPDSASSYVSLTECLHQHAENFLGEGFANPKDDRYFGSWFGDKDSGINRQYASDPYWGEKSASLYYQIDSKDKEKIKVITFKAKKDIHVYNQKNGNKVYSYKKGSIVSFIVSDEDDTWYTVTSEAPIKHGKVNASASYNKTQNRVYVRISDVD